MNYAQKSLFLLTGNVPRVLSFKGGVGVMSDEFYPSFPIESDFFFFHLLYCLVIVRWVSKLSLQKYNLLALSILTWITNVCARRESCNSNGINRYYLFLQKKIQFKMAKLNEVCSESNALNFFYICMSGVFWVCLVGFFMMVMIGFVSRI